MHRGDDVHQKNGDHSTMTEPVQAVHTYAQAVAALTPQTRTTLDPFLADDVVVAGPISPGSGRAAVLEALGAPNASRLLGSAEWGEPIFDGDTARLEAVVPPGSPVRGMVFTLAFDSSGRITRVDQQILAAPPPPVTELALTPEIVAAVNGALANATPVIVAYVDASGSPHLSLRGSTQAFGDQQLAIWIRDPQGGLLSAIEENPAIALWYRDPAARTNYQFSGRARVAHDQAVRDVVYDNTPEPERNLDPRRLGVAVVVDLDKVEGAGPSGRFRMARSE